MIDETLDQLTDLLADCYDDPDLFNTAILQRPDYWSSADSPEPEYPGQLEWCRALVEYHTVAVETGNMLGKDYWIGGIVPWWLWTRPDSLVFVTGPGQTTLGSVTWKEIRRAIEGCPFWPYPLGARISVGIKTSPHVVEISPGYHALGYSTTTVERASGQHSGNLLVIVEEASGVEDHVWEVIDSLGASKVIAIGNPLRAEGGFVRLCDQADADMRDGIAKDRAMRHLNVPSTASPHAKQEKSDVGLASAIWIEQQLRKWGKNSLWALAHIFAKRPSISADQLIPLPWLDWAAAQERDLSTLDPMHPAFASRRISGDLGEGVGRDSASVWVTDDYGVLEVVFGDALGLAETAYHYHRLGLKWGVPHERMSYDRLGIGREFHLHLARLGIITAVGYAGSGESASGDFTNLRTEAAWRFRQRLDPQGATDHRTPHASRSPFVIPPGDYWPRLREELSKLTYHLVKTKIALLSKEDHAKVLGHSPDLSDGLCQGFGFA